MRELLLRSGALGLLIVVPDAGEAARPGMFLIPNTQNRDTEAIQVKLDELIRATKGVHNALLDLEELEDGVLDDFRRKYELLATAAREGIDQGNEDTGTPEP